MKDHVKSGAIFRLKNTAALKHTRPPTSRPSAFSRQGKAASRPVATTAAPRRRVVGLGRPDAGSTFARMVGKPVPKSTNVLIYRRRNSTASDEGDDVGDTDDDSVTSSDDQRSPSPPRVQRKAKRSAPPVLVVSSSEDEESNGEDESSGEASEGEEENAKPTQRRRTPQRRTQVKRTPATDEEEASDGKESSEEEVTSARAAKKRKTPARSTRAKRNTSPVAQKKATPRSRAAATKKRPVTRKRRASALQDESSGEGESKASGQTTAPKQTAKSKPRGRSAASNSSEDSSVDSPVRKKAVRKKTPTRPEPAASTRSSGRRERKPVTQWWVANPETGIDLGSHPEPKSRRRLSEPGTSSKRAASKTGTRKASGSPPARKRRASRSKPSSEPRKRRKRGTKETAESASGMDLPKPELLNNSDDDAVTMSVFAKASPAKKLSTLRRRSPRMTPLNKKNVDSPHLTPITPMRASRLVQALFTFDGEDDVAALQEIAADTNSVPMQPLRSSHDEFGMPNLPYPDNQAMADANWYTLEQ